jgi:hypothetical protein
VFDVSYSSSLPQSPYNLFLLCILPQLLPYGVSVVRFTPGQTRFSVRGLKLISCIESRESTVTMASKHPVDGIKRQYKRRRVVGPTKADVQVKAELDGPIFQEQGRIHSNVQSTASQSTTSPSTTSPLTASKSIASQPVLDWFAEYKSCESFFLNHAQASPYVQAL